MIKKSIIFKVYIVIFCLALLSCHGEKKNYCGKVIELGKENPTSGYKSSHDARYFVVFIDRDCNKHIRVDCTVPTFFSLSIGENVCFELNKLDLQRYGNGYKHLK
jgi:hypothetical protein